MTPRHSVLAKRMATKENGYFRRILRRNACILSQCTALCCIVLQRVAERCSALQCVAVRCSALQCVAVRCSALQCVAVRWSVWQCVAVRGSALQCVAVHCNASQCAALQRVRMRLQRLGASDLSFVFQSFTPTNKRLTSEGPSRAKTQKRNQKDLFLLCHIKVGL